MRCLILFSACLVVAACSNTDRYGWGGSQYNHENVTELIISEGYPVQNCTVQTSDGYIIDVLRIPGPQQEKRQFHHQLDQSRNGQVRTGKPAVLLMHSLLGSSEEFVIGGSEQGLAYILADAGFDVFIGNSRGNDYARKHTKLNPEKDAAFWKFCWQDIGKKDLPAMIDGILEWTGQQKLYYVGYMQGTTAFYVLASELPEYNEKVEKMISLAPEAYLGNTKNAMLRYISEHQDSVSWQIKHLGVNEFKASESVLSNGGEEACNSKGLPKNVCTNSYFLLNGFNSDNFNMTTVKKWASRVPSGASSRQIIHYANLVKSGGFEKYAPNAQLATEEYDLSKISTPVALIYASDDDVSQEKDIKTLKSKLPNVVEDIKLTQVNSSMDLLFCKNVDSVVYKAVVDILKGR